MPGPVVCVSYLAAAELWTVPRFPVAGYGAEVLRIERSIAADGPMTAAALTALGVQCLLLANDVSDDVNGDEVRGWLHRYSVATAVTGSAGAATPRIVAVADAAGTRTWFPYLPGVAGTLAALDLSPVAGASFAYIDCYQLIEGPAVRAIGAARESGVPILLNLGGSPLSPAVAAAVNGCRGLVVQTNVDDADAGQAPAVAASILDTAGAAWVVVTAGAYGAVAVSRGEQVSVPGFRVVVRHTHCAGAAFSAGLLYGMLHGWPMRESVGLGCASGALRCERGHREPMPALAELRAVIGSRDRVTFRLPRTAPTLAASRSVR